MRSSAHSLTYGTAGERRTTHSAICISILFHIAPRDTGFEHQIPRDHYDNTLTPCILLIAQNYLEKLDDRHVTPNLIPRGSSLTVPYTLNTKLGHGVTVSETR